jgi:cation transport regulator ChaB
MKMKLKKKMNKYIMRWVHARVQDNLHSIYSSLTWLDNKEISKWVDKNEIIRSIESDITKVMIFNLEDLPPLTPSELDHRLDNLYGDAYMSAMRYYWDGDFPALPPNLQVMANALKTALKSKAPLDEFKNLISEWTASNLSLELQQVLEQDIIREAFVSGLHDYFPSPENISGTLAVSESLFQQKEEAWLRVIEQVSLLNFDHSQSFS